MTNPPLKQVHSGVSVWEQELTIPTYTTGLPDRNPMFLEKRVYQGSSGRVYPHWVIDKINNEKIDKVYQALCLENRYLFIMILPELGGRVQRAYDKTNGYDFVYYNQVIKPALVGLTGPWISGGIEFNWPQHHRPSTFDPVDSSIVNNEDGSASVIVSEIENMFRTRGLTRFTLHPDKAYLQIDTSLYNRTDLPQTFLWWANPAVAVNDHTQSIFPPDVFAVMDHGKRDVSKFPIATGVYYKQDYSAGVDISRYKNIPVPTSYMAYHSDFDFVGGYDHQKQAGILHIADHHISPGKKQWTWGCGDFGRAWDRNLTDEDGPYIELMTGCFTDNQPDFSWLMPLEEKNFTQFFMPYKNIGVVKNASIDLAVSLAEEDGELAVRIYPTGSQEEYRILLKKADEVVLDEIQQLSVEKTFERMIPVMPAAELSDYALTVYDSAGNALISYQERKEKIEKLPDPAKEIPPADEVRTNEDLFLFGMHLEQYRHATFLPEVYYREGLRRDPTDIRINNAYGALLLRQGQFALAEPYFKAAIAKQTRSNPNPYDGEPYYNLGVCLRLQNRHDEAFDMFYKATWNAAWQGAGFYNLACISALKHRYPEAIGYAKQALVFNGHSTKTRSLLSLLLAETGKKQEAVNVCRETLEIDPHDFIASLELALLEPSDRQQNVLEVLRTNPNWTIETAIEYAAGGFFERALSLLRAFISERAPVAVYPLIYYYAAYYSDQIGQKAEAERFRKLAKNADAGTCFPHRAEDLIVLKDALAKNETDSKAWYYLGNLWYDKRQYAEAIQSWETSRKYDDSFATVHRNLALAYYNKLHRFEEAGTELETAFRLNTEDARVFMELDQLRKRMGVSYTERLAAFTDHFALVLSRDDLYLEYITLQNRMGNHEKALELIRSHLFHPWEGGEGKAPAQYIYALTELGKAEIAAGNPEKAVQILNEALTCPANLGEGKLAGAKDNNIHYYLGVAEKMRENHLESRRQFEAAVIGLDEPAGMMYYNDQPPESIFYQGMALAALGETDQALSRFNKLINYGEKHLFDHVKIDYFAVSLPDLLIFDEDLDRKNKVHCLFMIGLGLLGKGEAEKAHDKFSEALNLDPNHVGLITHQKLCRDSLS